jgi:hypothetical protein
MSINRDLKVRLRASVILTERNDVDNPVKRTGKDGSQQHVVIDYPEFTVDHAEWDLRLADAFLALSKGYELTGTQPPRVVTEDPTGVGFVVATLHGRVEPNVNTSCGFLYGITKELGSTVDAVESPLAGLTDDPVAIAAQIAGLTPNTRYYYRAWAQLAGVRVRYGRIRSFKTNVM